MGYEGESPHVLDKQISSVLSPVEDKF